MLDNVWYSTAVLLVAYIVINNFSLSTSFKEFENDKNILKNATQTDWGLDSIKRWNWRRHKSSLEDINKNHQKLRYKLSLHMPWKIWNKQKHVDHHSNNNFGKIMGYRAQQLQKQLNGPPAFMKNGPLKNSMEFIKRKYRVTTPGYYYRWSKEKASHYQYERSLSIYEDVNDTVDIAYSVRSYEQWFNYPLTTPSYPNPCWHLPTIQIYYEPYKRGKREAKEVVFWSKRRKEIEKKRIKKKLRMGRKKIRRLKAQGKHNKRKKGDGSYRGGRGRKPRSHTKTPMLNYTITPSAKRKKDKKEGENRDIKENATNKALYEDEYEEVEEVTYEEYDDDEKEDDDDESNDNNQIKNKENNDKDKSKK